jgi:hypothetical protein
METLKRRFLNEQIEDNSLSKMLDDKLREFNFYSASEKGKLKIVFNDDDRKNISSEFDDLVKKYPEDIAFIRAVVIAMGVDKKTEEPVVRLGSYYNNAEIELPFNSKMNGLGELLDGGVIYFTIINNEGPDLRDFKIVGGDQIDDVDFVKKEKEVDNELSDVILEPKKDIVEPEIPFEKEMEKMEKDGLYSLLGDGNVNDNMSNHQRKMINRLKKEGYLFKDPENKEEYKKVKINSKEFNESVTAWKKK